MNPAFATFIDVMWTLRGLDCSLVVCKEIDSVIVAFQWKQTAWKMHVLNGIRMESFLARTFKYNDDKRESKNEQDF